MTHLWRQVIATNYAENGGDGFRNLLEEPMVVAFGKVLEQDGTDL